MTCMNANDRVFIVDKDKTKQFLEDRKKNVISPEFLAKCLSSYKLLNRSKYSKIFLNEVKVYLESKYKFSCEEISLMLDKLSKMIIDDPVYIYHYDSEYWADSIAEAYGRRNVE